MVFLGPPDARTDSLAGCNDEVLTEIVSAPRNAAVPGRTLTSDRHSCIGDFAPVFPTLGQFFFEHHPVNIALAFKLEFRIAMSDFRDRQGRLQIDLHFLAGFWA